MVVDPHDARKCKAQKESEVRRPLAPKRDSQGPLAGVRNLDIENQQRDGDGEHAVRKGFNASGLRLHVDSTTAYTNAGDAAASSFRESANGARAIPRSVMIAAI